MTTSFAEHEVLGPVESMLSAHVARMVEAALLFCSSKTPYQGENRVAAALGAADPHAHDCFRHHLAHEVAEYLRRLDDGILGVYSYSYGDAEEEGAERGCSPTAPLNLILRVRGKTAALRSAVVGLDQALLEEYKKLIAPAGDRMVALLDVQMVDDEEMRRGTGFAAVLRSAFLPPTRVWPTS